MRETLAQLSEAADYVPYLNWQYIYCFFVSLFGGACNPEVSGVEVPTVEVPDVDIGDLATTTVDAGGGFWSWLWPFGSGGTGDGGGVAVGGTSEAGFWSGVRLSPEALAVVNAIGDFFSLLWSAFSWLSYSISGILFIAILGTLVGLALIRMKEWNDYGVLPPRPSGKSFGWSRWQDLLDAAMTSEPKRWREAIVAADDMLGELLTRLGYHGETTAEQLRSVPEGAFVTQSQAWEAHRIRNFVARRNSNFILTQREAFRVLKLYEQVFEEFDFI